MSDEKKDIRQATARLTTKVLKEGDESQAPSIEIVASTVDVDRENDTIDQQGWELDAYKTNPVVPWAHDYSTPPVASAEGKTAVENGQLVQQWDFTPRDVYPFGHMIGRMYEHGFLHTASVGFSPLEWNNNEDRGGLDFLRQELLESSAVVVPANPSAIVQARGGGIDTGPMVQWATKQLDEGCGDLQRKFVERLWQDAQSERNFMLHVEVDHEKIADEIFRRSELKTDKIEKEGQTLNYANRNLCKDALGCMGKVLQSAGVDPHKALEEKLNPDDEDKKMKCIDCVTRQIDDEDLTEAANAVAELRSAADTAAGLAQNLIGEAEDEDVTEMIQNLASWAADVSNAADEWIGRMGGLAGADADDPEEAAEDEPVDDTEEAAQDDEEEKSVAECNTSVAKRDTAPYDKAKLDDVIVRLVQ